VKRPETKDAKDKEIQMLTLNLKSVTSGFAALALTVILSWAFVAGTNIELAKRDSSFNFVVAATALVR
jgi:hypothetical protein